MRRAASGRLFIAAIGAALFSGAHAQSVPPTVAADLLRSCSALTSYASQGGEITVDATSCAAYLKGLRDGVDAPSPSRSAGNDRAFCAAGVGLDELARAVTKHLQERPEAARKHAATEALAALTRAFPCPPARK